MSNKNLIKIVSDGSGIVETISCCKLKLDDWNSLVCKQKLDWCKYWISQVEVGFQKKSLCQ